MNSIIKYFKGLFSGIKSLLIGMSVTWKELWTKKVTNQYPENRDTLVISDRFRAELVMLTMPITNMLVRLVVFAK